MKPKNPPEPVATVTRRGAFHTRYRIDNLPGYRSCFATVYEFSTSPMLVEYESRSQIMREDRQAKLRPVLQKAIDKCR